MDDLLRDDGADLGRDLCPRDDDHDDAFYREADMAAYGFPLAHPSASISSSIRSGPRYRVFPCSATDRRRCRPTRRALFAPLGLSRRWEPGRRRQRRCAVPSPGRHRGTGRRSASRAPGRQVERPPLASGGWMARRAPIKWRGVRRDTPIQGRQARRRPHREGPAADTYRAQATASGSMVVPPPARCRQPGSASAPRRRPKTMHVGGLVRATSAAS